MNSNILIVDDDPAIAEMLTIILKREGFFTATLDNGVAAVAAVKESPPDLVLLDLMLPGMNGIDVCKQIRTFSGVPIIIITAKTDTIDVVLGLESGADDYLVKPFKQQELLARIRARLRRVNMNSDELLHIMDITIDVKGHRVLRGKKEILLTPLEFDLLATLAQHPDQVYTREMLLEQVWGYPAAGDTRLVNVHVQRLRTKIEKNSETPQIVLTIRGVGYKAGLTQK